MKSAHVGGVAGSGSRKPLGSGGVDQRRAKRAEHGAKSEPLRARRAGARTAPLDSFSEGFERWGSYAGPPSSQ